MNEEEMKAYEGYLLGEVNTVLDNHFNKIQDWEKSIQETMRKQVNEIITPLIREIAGMQISVIDATAISAMQGMISTAGAPCLNGLDGFEDHMAKAAYKIADAMIEARK